MIRLFVKLLAVLGSFALIAVSSPAEAAGCGKGTGIGAIVGGLAGALGGRAVAGRKDRTLGTILGGVGGAALGGVIGRSLDKCEQEKVAAATSAALDSPRAGPASKQTWASPSRPNVSGTVTTTPAVARSDGRVCRSVTRVSYIDGQEMQESPTFCRAPPSGAWAPAQS